jgi:hypothetical protein
MHYFHLLQTLKLNNEKRKKSLFYEEKCLVGLTQGQENNVDQKAILPNFILQFLLKRFSLLNTKVGFSQRPS